MIWMSCVEFQEDQVFTLHYGNRASQCRDIENYKTNELGDKAYLSAGKALNTKEKVDVGDIVRVKEMR